MRRESAMDVVDTSSVDGFLAACDGAGTVAVLLSTGDPARFPESSDVAVILPELCASFGGRLRAARIAPDAEKELGKRFGVEVQPTLIFVRGGETLGLIAKIQDWSVYQRRIATLLERPHPSSAAAVVRTIIPPHHQGSRS